jgi:D-alanyl-D-alanine carboxypeptidase (penicillin-binding protein 5/6)
VVSRMWTSPLGASHARLLAAILAVSTVLALLAPRAVLASRHHRTATAPAAPAALDQSEGGENTQAAGLTGPYATACAMEPTTATVIFERDMHQPWPTASITKMMPMLIVAEKLHDGSLKPTDQINTSRSAAKMGGSQVYLKEGETFSLDDMMKAVVVHSANDATYAVAEYVAGSTEAFVQMMNERAHQLGMKDTKYYSVHGLPPGPGQQADVSSAYDSALLARELVKYPDVLRWSRIDTAPFRNGSFTLRNTNHLVRTMPGCDGLKTGFYAKAGFNVVATAKRNGLRLIAVVMGSPRKGQNFHEAEVMLSRGFLDYTMYQVAKRGAPISQAVVVNGGAAPEIRPVWADDVSVFVKHGEEKNAIKVSFDLPLSVDAPVKAGQTLGKGEVMLAGKPAASAAIIAPTADDRGSILRRWFQKL